MTLQDWAAVYLDLGWVPIPLHWRQKMPMLEFRTTRGSIERWHRQAVSREELPRLFGTNYRNIGVLLGRRSGGLVDVDLDNARSVALAPIVLPPTLTFGRSNLSRTHWLYVTRDWVGRNVYGKRHELRGNRCISMVPPSTHPTGGIISWDNWGETPARIDSQELKARLELLQLVVDLAWLRSSGVEEIRDAAVSAGLGWPVVETMLSRAEEWVA